jgi:uncharacterized protein (UPF0548 family)
MRSTLCGCSVGSSYGPVVHRRYARAVAADPTYPDVGAAVTGRFPPGYDHIDERVRVGPADEFERARAALFTWTLQRHARVHVHPPDARPAVGATVLLLRRFGPFRVIAPCRVTWAEDRPGRAGFAYGSLPGHPERGEESFVLDRDEDGTWLRIRAFSRPARWYARLGAPVTRLVQRRILAAYLRAICAVQPSANS